MSHSSQGARLWAAAIGVVAVLALVESVTARSGGRGGTRGGGVSRGAGGFSRAGPAASGSLAPNQPGRLQRGEYDTRGPAADGSFGEQYPDPGERQERREERHERRDAVQEDRREDWQEYREDYYDDGSDEGDYDEEVLVYWTLPCRANVIAMGGVTYYVCGSAWYTRAYSEGDVVYVVVPNPTGH